MYLEGLKQKIRLIENGLSSLPKGYISVKVINGKAFSYLQWTENGKKRSRYLSPEEAEDVKNKIEERKTLEAELKKLKALNSDNSMEDAALYINNVRTGNSLVKFAEGARKFAKRECYSIIENYIFRDESEKLLVLYGLRRTGKTTLIRQVINSMPSSYVSLAAFLHIKPGTTISDLNKDLLTLEDKGFKYIFIDEITVLSDFISGSAFLADIFAASGMKIVLSGTDSLGFMIAADDQLYDRCIFIHTTFIPYREFERVLGIKGIDEYIRYGGTMCISGTEYNSIPYAFENKRTTGEYVDSAIANNIQHSLRFYQDGGHFRSLYDLFEKGELTSAVNRVIEDINHRFTVDVLTRDFVSSDLSLSANNLRRDRKNGSDILERIDREKVTERLRYLLEIKNKNEQSVNIEKIHADEIKEYLSILDLIKTIDVVSAAGGKIISEKTVVTQPGMRYTQAIALIDSLMKDDEFSSLTFSEKNAVEERILSEIKGRMMEDIILMETKNSMPDKNIFKLQFGIGEFDMVIFDKEKSVCSLYEIKHSESVNKLQYKNLINKEMCDKVSVMFGEIQSKTVIYRGVNCTEDGIKYINAEEYLNSLGDGRFNIWLR